MPHTRCYRLRWLGVSLQNLALALDQSGFAKVPPILLAKNLSLSVLLSLILAKTGWLIHVTWRNTTSCWASFLRHTKPLPSVEVYWIFPPNLESFLVISALLFSSSFFSFNSVRMWFKIDETTGKYSLHSSSDNSCIPLLITE